MGHCWTRKISNHCSFILQRYFLLITFKKKDAQVAILVCDVTDKHATNGVKDWLTDLEDKGPDDIGIFFCWEIDK